MAEVPVTRMSSGRVDGIGAGIVGLAALLLFGWNLQEEPSFVDEWAYVSQAYFLDLLAQPDHPAWLEYPALDLPPLPKFGIGLALRLGGYPLPSDRRWVHWYQDTHTTFGPPEMLTAARWPSVVLGAMGCVAVYALGTLVQDRRVGLAAAALLMVDPLYRMHARRAMSDIYTEGFVLLTAAVGLWAWRTTLGDPPTPGGDPESRRPARLHGHLGPIVGYALAGVAGGLAVLSKLSGVLGLFVLGAWAALALVLPNVSWKRKALLLGETTLAGLIAAVTFTILNPFLTANPASARSAAVANPAEFSFLKRCALIVEHRLQVPREQQRIFPHNALLTWRAKLSTVAVQGFGRFGPLGRKVYDREHPRGWFDSTKRYDGRQDRGAVVWLPWVGLGLVWASLRGWNQVRDDQPPTAWAVLVQALLTLAIVTAFLPLAWDRYFLSLQPGSCLLAAGAALAGVNWCRKRTAP